MDRKQFCLNMIVKNESKIIKETLLNILKYIDYWVISDTGSTDNTIEEIKNIFKELNIPGEIHNDEWFDFGTNRSLALTHAFNKCDYIWVMDADDLIVGDIIFPDNMDADGYSLKIGKNFVYTRQFLFKSSLVWRYRGVVHEYPECVSKSKIKLVLLEGDYYINSRRLGNRSNEPNKYLNDAIKLESALEKDKDLRSRYLFYIGQSYYDHCDYKKSLEWYKKRVEEEKGWIEETYYSYIKIVNCMIYLSYSKNDIIKTYLHLLTFKMPILNVNFYNFYNF